MTISPFRPPFPTKRAQSRTFPDRSRDKPKNQPLFNLLRGRDRCYRVRRSEQRNHHCFPSEIFSSRPPSPCSPRHNEWVSLIFFPQHSSRHTRARTTFTQFRLLLQESSGISVQTHQSSPARRYMYKPSDTITIHSCLFFLSSDHPPRPTRAPRSASIINHVEFHFSKVTPRCPIQNRTQCCGFCKKKKNGDGRLSRRGGGNGGSFECS